MNSTNSTMDIDMDDISITHAIWAESWCLFALSAVFVFARLYLRWRGGYSWNFADGLLSVGLLFYLARVCMDTVLAPLYENLYLTPQSWWFYVTFAEDVMYFTPMYCVKGVWIIFFYELIPRVCKKTRIALHFTAAFTIIGYIAIELVTLLWCLPYGRMWSTDPDLVCWAWYSQTVTILQMVFHIGSDIMIYILPLTMVPRLTNVPRSQRISVSVFFILGFGCILFAVLTFVGNWYEFSGTVVVLWPALEQSWAFIVVCCPSFRALIVDKILPRVLTLRSKVSHSDKSASHGSSSTGSSRKEQADVEKSPPSNAYNV